MLKDSTFDSNGNLQKALEILASTDQPELRGAVSTNRDVVELILDLVGYTVDKKLYKKTILEPSFGDGDFLFPIIERLLLSWQEHHPKFKSSVESLSNSLCAVEIHQQTFEQTRSAILKLLYAQGFSDKDALHLVDCWLIQGDFLLFKQDYQFDYVVGNPPYLRQEAIPTALLQEYRRRYSTMFDRADIYVAFYEKSLQLLKPFGSLGFICADRWTKNQYGGPLRELISDSYNLKVYIGMEGADSFSKEVSAYPAITIISREKQGITKVVPQSTAYKDLQTLSKQFQTNKNGNLNNKILEIAGIVNFNEPWILECNKALSLLRGLENQYPSLEEVGCKVGIGVATGADRIYIQNMELLPIEEELKMPLVRTEDVASGQIEWQGRAVINTFTDTGEIIDLKGYPKLATYLEQHADTVKNRHIAKRNPNNWFRTIDRIDPSLLNKHKLLIPDIKGQAHVVYDSGNYYPHHNLYYVTSDIWDLRALQAVLLSSISEFFIKMYSTKMRGGYLRFQAQYLRRIRVPNWGEVPVAIKDELIRAALSHDRKKCNHAAFKLYELDKVK